LLNLQSGLAGSGGFFVNLYEIGGQYTGVIIGLVNTIGTFAGIIAPFLVGFITQNVKIYIYFIFQKESSSLI
jgi:hypothetical protein